MSYSNGIVKAPIVIDENGGDIGNAIGVASGDLGVLCSHANNNRWNVYKPIKHPNNEYVTLQQRIDNFHGLVPKNMASTFKSTTAFSTIPSPEAWGYVQPNGTLGTAPYRQLDYAHIETDLSQIATANGYDSNAQAPLMLDQDVTISISTNPAQGDVLCPIFKYNNQSANAYGVADIVLYLKDLIFRKYGTRDNVTPWKNLPSSYDDIFNAAGAMQAGVWRFAMAMALKVSASTYKWLIVSSPQPLSLPFMNANDTSVFLNHVIRPSYNQVVANAIKYAVRNYGQTQIDCIPFLACNLAYTEQAGWTFLNTNYDLAVTFPRGDKFKLTPSGFATVLDMQYTGFRVAYTNSNSVTQDVTNLTWYNAQPISIGGYPYVAINLPRPDGYSYCIMEFTFNMNTHFGQSSNMVGGMLVSSGNTPGQMYTNDNSAISSIDGEWISTAHTYKVRQMGPNLHYLMANTPSSTFPIQDVDGFDVFFDNTQKNPQRQHQIHAGTRIALIS